MQGTQPVPSSMAKRRNLLGLWSRSVTVPTVSARERGMPLRENESEEEEGNGVWVRERRSKARSLTCVLCSEFSIFVFVLCVLLQKRSLYFFVGALVVVMVKSINYK